MLYIGFTDGPATLTWKQDQSFPIHKGEVGRITWVEADGEELRLIKFRIKNIPMAIAPPSQRWFGDHAKFVVDFLRVYCEEPVPLDPPKHIDI